MAHCFVELPEGQDKVYLCDPVSGKEVRQVLWGDFLLVEEPIDPASDWLTILWAWKSEDKKGSS